jgi:hypothetical protein
MKQLEKDSMAGGKRDDPGYAQVSGYIPKKLALKFKAACTMRETTQSEALEKAVEAWLQQADQDQKAENQEQ